MFVWLMVIISVLIASSQLSGETDAERGFSYPIANKVVIRSAVASGTGNQVTDTAVTLGVNKNILTFRK
jgi:hypothetical protein